MPRLSTTVAGLVLGLVTAAVPATAAHATSSRPQDGPGTESVTSAFKNRKTGMCLDDSDSSGLRAIGCNGTPYQTWAVTTFGSGLKEFKNRKTGRCLDDSRFRLRTFPCNGYAYQRWTYEFVPDENHNNVMANVTTNRCVDHSNSIGLRSAKCNGTAYQLWDAVYP